MGQLVPEVGSARKNGCRELHHRLLHKLDVLKSQSKSPGETEVKRAYGNDEHLAIGPSTTAKASSVTEGNDQHGQTTMMAQNYLRTDLIRLRTVPIIIKNEDRLIKVNALLDDASTQTYINTDVAAELGLHGKPQKVTVNVLNGQIETFDTKPISLELRSINGNVSTRVTAFTADRVTGSMTVVNWIKYSKQWPHLKNKEFPSSATRPIVDVFMGLDWVELHCALEEVPGNPGEPIARLTPLGWTCIGNPGSKRRHFLQKNFASTYFAKNQLEIERLNGTLKRFWEIEDVSTPKETPVMSIEERSAMRTVEESITYENSM